MSGIAIAIFSYLSNSYDWIKLLDAAETVLGIFGFDRTMYGNGKNTKWWVELKRNRCGTYRLKPQNIVEEHNSDEVEIRNVSHMKYTADREYLAYHKVKRKFLPITEIESDYPEDIQIYEFGQNFKLIAK